MRILILSTDIYTRGGIARYTATLATALGQLLGPANVDLLPLLDDPERRFNPPGFRILGATTTRLTLGGKIRHAQRALRQGASGYDFVFCSHVSLAPIAALLRSRYATPYFVVCYGSEVWHRLPLVKRLALRRACLILADSQFTADLVAEANGVPVATIRLLVNAIPDHLVRLLVGGCEAGSTNAATAPGSHARLGGPVLLSVGSLSTEHSYKGVDTVIEALPDILKSVPGARYVVVGDGDNRRNLERLAARRGVEGRITFAGEVSDIELAEHYHSCDVFVLPSRMSLPHDPRYSRTEGEGFGRVYVEAALAGKPVVGSRDGGAAEAVRDGQTGMLVDPRSAREVAGAVIALLKSPEKAVTMGAEGRRWAAASFTLETMRRSLEEILSSVVRDQTSESSVLTWRRTTDNSL